jgi:hypothetical protein
MTAVQNRASAAILETVGILVRETQHLLDLAESTIGSKRAGQPGALLKRVDPFTPAVRRRATKKRLATLARKKAERAAAADSGIAEVPARKQQRRTAARKRA